MRVKIYGAKGVWCQTPRIIEGFKGLNHDVTKEDDCDFVYVNNPPFDKGDEEFDTPPCSIDAYKIFNVLDIPEHIPNFNLDDLFNSLLKADLITCISPAVKEQIKRLLGLEAKVVWNPIKDIFLDNYKVEKDIDFLYVGRANDPNKRFNLLDNSIREKTVVVGSENPGNCQFVGQQPDVVLNSFYNRAKFVLLPSKFEGLGLTALEAMAAGSIPIVCYDNPNSFLCPSFCMWHHMVETLEEKIDGLEKCYKSCRDHILDCYTYKIQKKFSKFSIARNIIEAYREKTGAQLEK